MMKLAKQCEPFCPPPEDFGQQRILYHEVFHTFQGEGDLIGMPAFFLRTFGCPHHCPFCDAAGTWHPKYRPPQDDLALYPDEKVCGLVAESKAPWCVITGGEPTIYDLRRLTSMLAHEGVHVALETTGAWPIQGYFHHVTISPKRDKEPLEQNVRDADELKLIIQDAASAQYWLDKVNEWCCLGLLGERHIPLSVWLQPEWGAWMYEQPRGNALAESLRVLIPSLVKQQLSNWPHFRDRVVLRAGVQLHKYYQVDQLDARSRPAVPLGGDVRNGY
jgi:organic radical activating enzyme